MFLSLSKIILLFPRLKQVPMEDTSSKEIISVVPTSYVSQIFEPSLVDKMVRLFIDRKNVVSIYSTIVLLEYLYRFGYTPERCDEFIDFASQLIVRFIFLFHFLWKYFKNLRSVWRSIHRFYREKDEMLAYHVICAAISLCYFNNFPRQLSDYIFNMKFLDYINTETSLMSEVNGPFRALVSCFSDFMF